MVKKILTVLIILFISATQTFAGDLENFIRNGNKNFRNRNYNSAIINFENALKLNDNMYDVYCKLGLSYGMTGKIKKSEKAFKTAVRKSPNEWRAYTYLGDIERAKHNVPAAIDYYEKAIQLPTMPQDGKKYFNNLIQTVIKEQQQYDKNIPATANPKISINLDKNKWDLAYFKGDNQNWIVEYGLKNEDVVHYKWSKLITINFFSHYKYNFNLTDYYNKFTALLKEQASSTNRKLHLKKISENNNEIYFIWSISDRNESEVCRVFTTKKGLYFAHFAEKKNRFTQEEIDNIITMLKSIQIAE